MRATKLSVLLVSVFLVAPGCTEDDAIDGIGGSELGEDCKQISDCRAGLTCQDKECVQIVGSGDPAPGDVCQSDVHCGDDLYCGSQGLCTTAPPRQAGEACGLSEDCDVGLICLGTGVCGAPSGAGSKDIDQACDSATDCRRPYVCGPNDTCVSINFYPGADCTRSDQEAGLFRMYFEVPPAHVANTIEFYRLPFPSDVRVRDGFIDLSGHPSPGEVLGIDVPGLYFSAIESDTRGFATNAPVFVRFSDKMDLDSLCLTSGSSYPTVEVTSGDTTTTHTFDTACASPTVYLVNLDNNERVPVEIDLGFEHAQYICSNWLGMAPIEGMPLEQETSYAVVVTTGLLDRHGDPPILDRDFELMLSSTAPSVAGRPEVADAHAAMAPLRAWMSAHSIDVDTIAGAAVFTTGDLDAMASKLRSVVRGGSVPAPTIQNAVLCDGAVLSPCDDGFSGLQHQRGCYPADAAFHIVQGTYANPILQFGTAPYKEVADGGYMELDQDGNPIVQGVESMCFALAVPTGVSKPGSGWPTVIYAHGTAGSFNSFVFDGTAAQLTALGYAVISFENVSHGFRQGLNPNDWELDPGGLFFNVTNPRAARDNILQGAADLFQLVRLVETGSVTLTGPGAIDFDATKLFFFGHSQGTVIAPAFLAAEPLLDAAVLSGAGSELALSILHKKKPIDLSEVAGVFFADQNLSRVHPMMGLMAQLFAPSDAVGYAHTWVLDPQPPRTKGLHILQTYGLNDSFTPEVTQAALIRSAGYPIVGLEMVALDGVDNVTSPQTGNVLDAVGNSVTAGVVQANGPNDGHFVAFDNVVAKGAVTNFLDTAEAATPTIQR